MRILKALRCCLAMVLICIAMVCDALAELVDPDLE